MLQFSESSTTAWPPAIATSPLLFPPDTPAQEAIAAMSHRLTQANLGQATPAAVASCILVVAQRQLLGRLSQDDIIHHLAQGTPLNGQALADVLVPTPWITLSQFNQATPDSIQAHLTHHRYLPIYDPVQNAWGLVSTATLQAAEERRSLDAASQSTAPSIRQDFKLLEHILDSILAGYWDWDMVSGTEYLSRGFKAMLGYEEDELPNVPESWKLLIFPEDMPKVVASIQEHIDHRGKQPFRVEVRYRHKNGSTVWILCTGQVVSWNPDGTPHRMVGCHVNISPHKEIEVQLQHNQDELERFFNITLNLLCIADTNGHFRRVNRTWTSLLGYTAEELEGRSFLDFVHPDDLDATLAAIATLEDQTLVQGFINRYCAKDGSYRYLEWYSQPYGDLIYAAAHDVTDRRMAERQLRKRDAHLRAAQRIAQLGSWEFDIATEEIHWSDEVFRIFGRDPALGMPSFDELQRLYHPEDQDYHNNTVQRGIETGTPYDLECRAYRPDGSLVYIQARGEPIFDASGQLIQLVGTILDITARKETELQLRQATAQLAASNQELEAFAYSVSHDLRSPLRAIDGFSKALLEDYGDRFDDDAMGYFNRIRHNIQRMGDLIDDLLRLSRVSRSEMQYGKINLSTLVWEQVNELRVTDPERQVTVDVAPDAIAIADATLLRVVISNLMQNAWKFTSHHPTAHIEFGCIPGDECHTYFVRDDGAGFDMAYANQLFGVFQRLHNTHEFPGTGIGLATVQRAIHRHGGQVWAEGAIEQGATVYFTLPHSSLRTSPTP
jgi:PAS domain S-box-containing protein